MVEIPAKPLAWLVMRTMPALIRGMNEFLIVTTALLGTVHNFINCVSNLKGNYNFGMQ